MSDFKITYTSHAQGKGGQHTNGPDYGIVRVEHEPSGSAVEVDTYLAGGAHLARDIGLSLCQLAISELRRTPSSRKEGEDG